MNTTNALDWPQYCPNMCEIFYICMMSCIRAMKRYVHSTADADALHSSEM